MVMEDSKLLQLFIKEISLEIKKMDLEYWLKMAFDTR
jgi:hypothetical protein